MGSTSAVNPARVNPAGPVTQPAPTAAPTAPFDPPPLRSVAGEVIPTRKVTVNGLGGSQHQASNISNRFAREADFDRYTGSENAPVARGFVRTSATAIPGGFRLKLESFHKDKNDRLTLYLMAEVLDTKSNQHRPITLAVLTQGENLNGESFKGVSYFDVSYKEINDYLKARNASLEVTPGVTMLAVAASFRNGHQAGGFSRGGDFRLPMAGKSLNVVSVRAGGAVSDQADLPLDMQVAYPEALTKQVPALLPGGSVVSRLESELKGTASGKDMAAATRRMYELVAAAQQGKRQEIEAVLGKDWTVETVNRYWLRDDGSPGLPGSSGTGAFKGFRVDEHGLPIQDPMHDVYMDDGGLTMTRHEGAIRLRKNKQATGINIKPGGGRRDERTLITQRIEIGHEMKPETTVEFAGRALGQLAQWQWAGTIFNQAQREVTKLDKSLLLANTLVPWLDVVQNRHKFTAKNEVTGVEIELSFDRVECKTLRPEHAGIDGAPRTAEFYVLEAELDHLQLASKNQSSYAANGIPAGGSFSNDAAQDAWLKQTSEQVTMNVEPRLHELEDLQNASFRSTASYKAFEQVIGKLVPSLFPNGLEPGRQKSAASAEQMGLLFFSDTAMLAGIESKLAQAGYAWSPALAQAYAAAVKDPAKKQVIEQQLLAKSRDVSAFVSATVGALPLDYDLARVKERVGRELGQLGFASSPQIDAMLGGLTTAKLPPQAFEAAVGRMAQMPDAQLLQPLSQPLGLSQPPAAKPDVKALFGATSLGVAFANTIETAGIDLAQLPELEAFFVKAVAAGAAISDVRNIMRGFGNNQQGQLDSLAQARNIGPAPVLRASLGKLLELAQGYLQPRYFKIDDSLKAFFEVIRTTRPHAEAFRYVHTLNGDPRRAIEQEAARLGRPAPAMTYDYGAINDYLKPYAKSAMVQLDASLEQFIRASVDGGVPVANLQRLFSTLGNYPDLAAAMRSHNVSVGGVQPPKLAWDLGALENHVRNVFSGYAAVIDQKAVPKFVADLVGSGLTASQATRYCSYMLNSGRLGAASQGMQVNNTPSLPVDVDALSKHLAARCGTTWTPALEAYVRSTLPKALASQSFALSHVFSQTNGGQLASVMQQHSGVPRPQGV